jgi:hypothetical protein
MSQEIDQFEVGDEAYDTLANQIYTEIMGLPTPGICAQAEIMTAYDGFLVIFLCIPFCFNN